MIRKSFIILVLTAFILVVGCDTEETETFTTFRSFSLFGEGVAIDVDAEYETLIADGVPHLDYNGTSFFIGYRQVSSNNQDPVMMRFNNGELTWVRTDLETSADDSKGYGVFWDGAETMYAVFSSTGTQGEPSIDFRRFATNSWIPSYGQGGGAKIAIIARINIQTGQPEVATFVKAKLSNGNANSVVVKSLQ
ncbi:MAG: hypothetical protein PF489_00410, partial [Salinivirgaceae bacterium]|nr:hypothetical protein [Salinivirgaceae bacterium]